MRWKVVGADKNTGKDVTRVYPVDTEEAARHYAHEDGILVSTVEIATEPKPRPAVPDTVDYRSRWPDDKGPTQYLGLIIAGRVIGVFAVLYYVTALLWGVISTNMVLKSGSAFQQPLGMLDWVFTIGSTLTLAMVGGLLHGLSSACFALRDIARNSWK